MSGDFTVVICTRDRAAQLRDSLAALSRQTWRNFDILVVDQSTITDADLQRRSEQDARFAVIRDAGQGLSRSRNIAWPVVGTEWVVYLDDDCVPETDWAAELDAALHRALSVDFVSGHISAGDPPAGDYLVVSEFPVAAERLRSGRWTKPWHIGFGVCMAIRRSTIARLGGWDEHLGAGTTPFPAAEDMDFNYRFLKCGGTALATPRVRAHHQQWRTPGQLGILYRGYMAAWCGFAMKHLRSGDVAGGLWLWSLGFTDVGRMLGSGLRRRSSLRLGVAWSKSLGLVAGTAHGLVYRW